VLAGLSSDGTHSDLLYQLQYIGEVLAVVAAKAE